MSYTIILKGGYEKLQSKSLASGQTPYPGMLLMEDSNGALTVHATQGGYAEKLIALEDALQGKTVSDAYTAETVCDCAVMQPGSHSQVLLKSGENVSIGDFLVSAGNGKFEKLTSTYIPLCVAIEACDLSNSLAVDTLVKVRWL